jgi:glycerol-3-phosphate dehydrogenase
VRPSARCGYLGHVTRVTVFGAGAKGTAFAMHSARIGNDTHLWANPHDLRAYEALIRRPKTTLASRTPSTELVIHGPTNWWRPRRDDSTRDVQRLAKENAVDIPYHSAIHRVLFEGADPREVLEVLR